MTFLDLCAGIGGFTMGLEWAGMKCKGQVEKDDFCTKVLEKNWPDAPRWRDVCECAASQGILPTVDLIAGGYPCQPFSLTGKRKGKRDDRATSGRSLSRSLPLKGPLGACLKTLLGTSRWASTMCFLTWTSLDTPHGACLFQLVPSTPRIDENGFGFWPTPLATNYKGGRLKPRQGVTQKQALTNNWQDFCSLVIGHRYPSPELTEAVMGFPTGHTEIKP